MRRGEIRWYKFAPPDKMRPVLILTRTPTIEYLGEVTIAPITSTIRDIDSEVRLGSHVGIPRECAVNCDHIQTVTKSKIGALLTTLPDTIMYDVGKAIQFALNI